MIEYALIYAALEAVKEVLTSEAPKHAYEAITHHVLGTAIAEKLKSVKEGILPSYVVSLEKAVQESIKEAVKQISSKDDFNVYEKANLNKLRGEIKTLFPIDESLTTLSS